MEGAVFPWGLHYRILWGIFCTSPFKNETIGLFQCVSHKWNAALSVLQPNKLWNVASHSVTTSFPPSTHSFKKSVCSTLWSRFLPLWFRVWGVVNGESGEALFWMTSHKQTSAKNPLCVWESVKNSRLYKKLPLHGNAYVLVLLWSGKPFHWVPGKPLQGQCPHTPSF